MPRRHLLALAIAAPFCAGGAQAVDLLAIGQINGSSAGVGTDRSGLTGVLENGVFRLLGGLGSGLTWAGGNTLLAVPDRRPNATAYNSLVDDTTSYTAPFHTLTTGLTPAATGSSLPFDLIVSLNAKTLLSSATPLNYGSGALDTDSTHTLGSVVPALNRTNNRFYFTWRSDSVAGATSTNPNNARLDPEAVRVSNDGIFVSDEYGPCVCQFDRATGQRIRSFALPDALAVAPLGPTTSSEGRSANSVGRVANKGVEGLAITPVGKTLVGILQAPLLQDTTASSGSSRSTSPLARRFSLRIA